jgi:glycine/D-amino acid oxidase-like deaminating enzyme
MAPRVDSIETDQALPARAAVVIVGGGIIGTSTALFLAQRGVQVVLCEKGHIAGEQSSRNWGWCRKMGRDPREIPLIIESMRLWEGMNEVTGAETGFRTCGTALLSDSEAELASYEPWLDHARPYQLDTRIIGSAEVARLMPGATKSWKGALYTASDGRAEPQKAAPAIAAAARRYGARIITSCAVRGIETKAGRVAGVVTENGRVACDAVVLAGGAWSRLFCGNLGIDLPQLKILGSVMATGKVEGGPETSAAAADYGFRKRLDGGYTVSRLNSNIHDIVPDSFRLLREFLPATRMRWSKIRLRVGGRLLEEWQVPRRWALDATSPFERVRVLDPEPATALLDEVRTAIAGHFPAFKNVRIAERWAGLIDVTPDVVPVISPAESLPGFFLATGFSGHGFGIGPGAGRLMADLVTGNAPVVDPTPFRLGRFSDGTKPKPNPLAL